MNVSGEDGGFAPIAPGPLDSCRGKRRTYGSTRHIVSEPVQKPSTNDNTVFVVLDKRPMFVKSGQQYKTGPLVASYR
jgi:hypothetical protein